MNENISKFFSEKSMMSCFEKKYASKYNFVLMRFKFMIILDFSFFHITKAKNNIDKTIFKKIF